LQAAQIAGANWRRIAVVAIAAIRLAHPGERVQGGEARTPIVGISACVKQCNREFEMSILHRQNQWAGAGARPFAMRFARLRRSFAFTSAPRASSAFTAPGFPVRAAVMSTVSPPRNFVFGSAPAARSNSTMAGFPFWHASESGVTP